ncbi:MAG: hypothetical protein AAF928_10095 [Myxococcota bacterium]
MVKREKLVWVLATSMALATVGCTTTEEVDDEGNDGSAPEFADGQGQAPWDATPAAAYPEGPFGTTEGQVIGNVSFIGYYSFVTSNALDRIELADFYNPTGDAVYPAEHPYAGRALPKVLVLTRSAVWCPPCNQEAAETPEHRAAYGDDVMFITTLFDDGNPNDPGRADVDDLTGWGQDYDPDYPITLDPDSSVGNLYPSGSIPGLVIIRTSDMRMVQFHNGLTFDPNSGALDPRFWDTVDDIIAGI